MNEPKPNEAETGAAVGCSALLGGYADTWRVHVLGPDDLIPMQDELHALREANMLNIGIARVKLKRPNDPNDPWCMAVVERNGVEYSKDQYPPNKHI